MPPAPPQSPESSKPNPPRFRWLKRIIALIVLLIAGVCILRLWWGHVAETRMQAEIDAIHARGEPILIEDFSEPTIPDHTNAAWYLRQAASAYVPPSQQVDNADFEWDKPISPIYLALFRAHLDANHSALQWARQARDYPAVAWKTPFRSPVLRMQYPDLSPQRYIANLLNLNAFTLHREDSDAEAIEAIRDCLRQSNAMMHYTPTLLSHLVAIGISSVAADDSIEIAPDLHLQVASTATQPSGPASREQVSQLIRELLDEREFREGAIRGYCGERMSEYDAFHKISTTSIGNGNLVQFLQPMFDLDGLRAMNYVSQTIIAIKQPDYPAAYAAVPYFKNPNKGVIATTTRILSTMLLPSSGSAVRHFRGLADRRAGAALLAIRLWQIDHNAEYPANLALLVPNFLPAIPLDPFASDGSPLRYKSQSPTGPIIYSVGENGTDEGGSEQPVRKRPSDTYTRYDRLDCVYHLQRPPAATQPSSETDDDNSNK